MIIIKLRGGLGNQMFQYAAGMSLSSKLKTNILIDLSWYENIERGVTHRSYDLGGFEFEQKFIKPQDYILQSSGLMKRIISPTKPYVGEYIEPSFNYNKNFFNIKNNTLIEGYFQSEKYFIKIRKDLLKLFKIKNTSSKKSNQIINQAHDCKSISLHVRRGDYISNKNAVQFHGFTNENYYKKAISLMNSRVDNPKYFIFSDDIKWVKNNFHLPEESIFVSHNKSGLEDMRIMVECKHNIIANSSFSWWSAWLGNIRGRVVIAPKTWLNDADTDTSDVIPERWIAI